MTHYFRGWKGSASHNPMNARLDRRSIIRPRGRRAWLKLLAKAGLMAALLGFVLFGSVFAYYSFTLPSPDKLLDRRVPESTKIFDRNGKQLYEVYGEAKRTIIPLDQIPDYAKGATIAVEDKDFYRHGGISFVGIIRAVVINAVTFSKRQGGSTITQQFVRNAVLTREKAYTRKIKEVILSLQLERRYKKDEILQLYFNEIPYGSNAYGIQAASQTFFGKDAKDLTLTESAYLAALPKAPTYYSPFGPHREELDQRADTVLRLMADQGYITKEEKEAAQGQAVEFRQIGRGILAPHFVMYVQDLLAEKYGEISLQEGGLKVTTTLDLDLQKIAEEAVQKQVPLNEKYNANNAAMVAIDPMTGQILAMVGSRDYFNKDHDGAVNVALRPRQPGSSFKPYIYAAAFKNGMSPATMLMDVETNFGQFGGQEYVPHNYDGASRGPVSIRTALQGSLNVPAVKTILLVGLKESLDMAERMGITTLQDRTRFGPSLVLGGGEVKLLDHVSAFGVFAANGVRHEPVAILKVEDSKGRTLDEYKESRGREVLDPQIAYQINSVLSDNEARAYIFGRSNRLTLPGRPVAAKTGTTQDYHDAWTVGYTPQLAAGVWVGNNNNAAMKNRSDGSMVSAPIWNEFMRRALEGKPVLSFTRPEGIAELPVDALSGLLPTESTPSTKTEVFASFNVPTQRDNVHVPVTADGQTQVYTVFHSERPDDPNWEAPVRAWAEAHGYPYPIVGDTTQLNDQNIQIQIGAPQKITSGTWRASAEVTSNDSVTAVTFFLDGEELEKKTAAPYEITTSARRVDGPHILTVEAATSAKKIGRKSATVEFAAGLSLLMAAPQPNQVLDLPANLVLETNKAPEPDDVSYFAKTAKGKILPLTGKITRQSLNTKVNYYTLNWEAGQKPDPGSYALYARIGSDFSNEVSVKIQ